MSVSVPDLAYYEAVPYLLGPQLLLGRATFPSEG